MLQNFHGFTDSGTGGDDILNDDDFLSSLGHVTHKGAAFAVVLDFLSVEEEGYIQTVLGKSYCCGNGQRNALISRTVQDCFLLTQLVKICLGIEFAHLGDLVTGLDHAGIDKVRDLTAGLSSEIAEFQNTCTLQELDKFSLVTFHGYISLYVRNVWEIATPVCILARNDTNNISRRILPRSARKQLRDRQQR